MKELFTRLHYYYQLLLRRTLHLSVLYSAFAKYSFYLNVSLLVLLVRRNTNSGVEILREEV